MSASKISAQMRLADQAGLNGQVAAGAYGAPSGLKGFPVLYHERGLVANTCGHLMHLRCFTQYCQGIEAKRQQQPTRNHPENPHRKEYLCPLCKSLGNILLPVLPHVGDYDPLSITDEHPERFAVPASQRTDQCTAEFEHWLQGDWREFGEAIVAVTNGRTSSKAAPALSTGPVSQAESSSASDREGASQVRTPSSSAPPAAAAASAAAAAAAAPTGSAPETPGGLRAMAQNTEDTLASGLIASLRNAGGFSFNLPEGLIDSLPRNLDLMRAAQRLPGGFAAVQALLQRFLQPNATAAFSLVPGSERMVLPLSQYVRWLFDMHLVDPHHHHHHQRRQGQSGTGSNSGYSTPETSGYDASFASGGRHMFPPNVEMQNRAAAEKEGRLRGQLEEYQFMYTRLFEVVQQVQRDNHVGLPSVALFEHIGKGKGAP
ncbi:E3 ubiquitin-protein ligase ubr1, partial [Linderina macrospora]